MLGSSTQQPLRGPFETTPLLQNKPALAFNRQPETDLTLCPGTSAKRSRLYPTIKPTPCAACQPWENTNLCLRTTARKWTLSQDKATPCRLIVSVGEIPGCAQTQVLEKKDFVPGQSSSYSLGVNPKKITACAQTQVLEEGTLSQDKAIFGSESSSLEGYRVVPRHKH